MRFIVGGILLFVFGLMAQNLLLSTSFILNQEEIALKFCENKDNPDVECNGKCHLAKQLNPSFSIKTEKTNTKTSVSSGLYFSFFEVIENHAILDDSSLVELNSMCVFNLSYLIKSNPTPPPELV
jgi:hypothetical protein